MTDEPIDEPMDEVGTSCAGWPLVRGGSHLSDGERAAGEAHALWCATCRSRKAVHDRNRRRLAAVGSASTVTATGTAAVLASLPAATVALAATVVIGTGAVVVATGQDDAPPVTPRPEIRASVPAPRTVLPSSKPAPSVVVPSPRAPRSSATVAAGPSRGPLTVVPSLPAVSVPTAVPTVALPTSLPTALPTDLLPSLLPSLLPRP